MLFVYLFCHLVVVFDKSNFIDEQLLIINKKSNENCENKVNPPSQDDMLYSND